MHATVSLRPAGRAAGRAATCLLDSPDAPRGRAPPSQLLLTRNGQLCHGCAVAMRVLLLSAAAAAAAAGSAASAPAGAGAAAAAAPLFRHLPRPSAAWRRTNCGSPASMNATHKVDIPSEWGRAGEDTLHDPHRPCPLTPAPRSDPGQREGAVRVPAPADGSRPLELVLAQRAVGVRTLPRLGLRCRALRPHAQLDDPRSVPRGELPLRPAEPHERPGRRAHLQPHALPHHLRPPARRRGGSCQHAAPLRSRGL